MKKQEMVNAIIEAANLIGWPVEVVDRAKARLLAKSKDVWSRHYDYVDSHKDRERAALYSIAVGTGIEIIKR